MAIFTIKETNEIIELLTTKCKLKFVDNSYRNDGVDSLHFPISNTESVHNYIEVYLPNLKIGYKNYCIKNQDDDELLLTEKICEVIVFLNNLN